jgi:small subunit ribosomal protein S9
MVKKTKNLKYYQAIGRRKEAVARVRLYLVGADKTATLKKESDDKTMKIKQGEIYVNGRLIREVFPTEQEKQRYLFPLKITNNQDRFAISILVKGGGKTGQLEAIIHGLSRALELVDKEEYRPILKQHKLLSRDPRKKERRKVGTGGKARRVKQSPKR